ncbi:N-acetylmuramoyl-L-alanine amidase [Shimazuella kribbensis]|uniref:N-acetylmuramoyl-L-alanine amidase n=1 Tax=Shimazuella kribbensis TaxID=139808 RepID=UPI000406F59C|nr:N-acetylmuramoyl-L-alanine amidase [Shimazuella kribbensis]
MKNSFLVIFVPCLFVLGLVISLAIVQEHKIPIKNLYLPSQNSKIRTKVVTHVLIHFISDAAIKPQNPYNIQDIYRIFVNTGTSSHYMIARDGTIYFLVGENRVAFHAGKGELPGLPTYKNKMNEYSIGIELLAIGTRNEMLPVMSEKTYNLITAKNIGYTDAQYRSLNILLNRIFKRYPSIKRDRKHIIGHDEYAPDRKQDPGNLFDWSRLKVLS